MNRVATLILSLAVMVAAMGFRQTAKGQTKTDGLPRLLPEQLEIDLALSGLPEHLRSDAAVYVLRRGGFKLRQPGSNGFTCFVQRTLWYIQRQTSGGLIPICYDDVGTETYLPIDFADAELREQGLSNDEVARTITGRIDSGMYGPPKKTGISYMLSPISEIPRGDGSIFRFVPHYMFYAPGMTDQELGWAPDKPKYLPALRRPGPHGMIIVRLGEKEIRAIEEREADLIAKVRAWLDEGT